MRSSYQRVTFSFGGPLTTAVKALLVATVAVFFCQALSRRLFDFGLEPVLGLVPFLVFHKGFVWQIVTYLFLHAGLFHAVFNLLALWMFGCELERIWGTRFFAKYFFVCGIAAGLSAALITPNSPIPTIGASGAIYGILLAYGLLFPDRQIMLWFLFPMKAKHFVVLIGLLAFYFSITSSASGISHVAHLGGLLAGYLYLRGWGLFRRLHKGCLEWTSRRSKRRYRVVRGGKDADRGRPVN
jgi:membrane associated rhomboid family serine protease